MEILTPIFNFINTPIGATLFTLSGIVFVKTFHYLNAMFKPVSYVAKFYDAADKIIEELDDRVIDKIRDKSVRKEIQNDLRIVLLARKGKIDRLISKLGD